MEPDETLLDVVENIAGDGVAQLGRLLEEALPDEGRVDGEDDDALVRALGLLVGRKDDDVAEQGQILEKESMLVDAKRRR